MYPQLERALTLFETGVDIRYPKTSGQSYDFDNKPWGGIAQQYAGSIGGLPTFKWEKIIEAASEYISRERGPSRAQDITDVSSGGRTQIVVSDEEVDLQPDEECAP